MIESCKAFCPVMGNKIGNNFSWKYMEIATYFEVKPLIFGVIETTLDH